MVTDRQVRRLRELFQQHGLSVAAAKAGMDEKTARKYRREGKLPSELVEERGWRTRRDPFAPSTRTLGLNGPNNKRRM